MRRRDRPFVLYRGGQVTWRLRPRNFRGWIEFAIWLALLGPIVLWLLDHVETRWQGRDFHTGLVLFAAMVVIWLIGGLWWMLARAELVNVVEVERQREWERRKREREARRAEAREHERQGD